MAVTAMVAVPLPVAGTLRVMEDGVGVIVGSGSMTRVHGMATDCGAVPTPLSVTVTVTVPP